MKVFLRIILIIILLVFLKTCCGLFYLNVATLTTDELQWFTKTKNITRTLKNSSGNKLQFFTHGTIINNDKNPLYFTFEGGPTNKDAYAIYNFKLKNSQIMDEGCFMMNKYALNDTVYIHANLRNERYGILGDVLPLNEVQTININNHVFKDCYIVNSQNSTYIEDTPIDNNLNIKEFIISKDYGIIYLKLINDDEYFLR